MFAICFVVCSGYFFSGEARVWKVQAAFQTVICTDGNEGTFSRRKLFSETFGLSRICLCARWNILISTKRVLGQHSGGGGGDRPEDWALPPASAQPVGPAHWIQPVLPWGKHSARHNNPWKGLSHGKILRIKPLRWFAGGVSLQTLLLLMSLRCVCSPALDEEFLSPQAAVTNDRVGRDGLGKSKTICFA